MHLLGPGGFADLDRSTDDATTMKMFMGGCIDGIVSDVAGIDELPILAGYKPNEVQAVFQSSKSSSTLPFPGPPPAQPSRAGQEPSRT